MASGNLATKIPVAVINSSAMMIICKHCGAEKDSSNFYLHKNGSWVRTCKECHVRIGREWRANNLEKSRASAREHQKRYATANPEAVKLSWQKWYAKNSGTVREKRRDRYWLDPEKARQAVKDAYRQNPEPRRAAARQWRIDNIERANEKDRQWRLNNPERIKILKHRHYLRRKDHIRAKNDAWEKANPEKARRAHQLWHEENPEKRAQYSHIRRARMRGNGFEKFSLKEIIQRDGYKCHICGGRVAKKDLSFDHLIPLSKGGPHIKSNVAVAHLKCNVKRGAGYLPAQLRLID